MNEKIRQRMATTLYGVAFLVIGGVLYLMQAAPAVTGIGTVLAFVGAVVFVIGLFGMGIALARGEKAQTGSTT